MPVLAVTCGPGCVAVTGIASTAVVALGGLGVQVLLAARVRREERRRHRFEELRDVYAEVGRLSSLAITTIKTRADCADEVPALIAGNPEFDHARHAIHRLRMAGAPPQVIAAHRHVWTIETIARSEGAPRNERGVLNHITDVQNARLGEFYDACEQHLREVWPRS